MPGRGPMPSDPATRRRRNVDPPGAAVAADGEVLGFDLPDLPSVVTDDGFEVARHWPALTVRWWERWRRSPQAKTFTETDWDFLLETALLHRAFVMGDLKQAAELRLRVAKFGATPEDRMRLRLQIVEPAKPTSTPTPQSGGDRKERLLKAVS